jgi:hypothetical protein
MDGDTERQRSGLLHIIQAPAARRELMLFQKNPLTMVGSITRCWLFTYQTPVEDARKLLPGELEPVTYRGKAFWNIVVCRIKSMRPKPLPGLFGVGYWHVAYRLYVRFHPKGEQPLEGLYFLRSDCDSRLISFAGNLMTDFNFHSASIQIENGGGAVDIKIDSPDAPAQARLQAAVVPQLEPHSAFGSLQEAADFLKYKPNGISVDESGNINIVHIKRREDEWQSRLVKVETARWSFFDDKNVKPEICYQVEPIFYQWNRGLIY